MKNQKEDMVHQKSRRYRKKGNQGKSKKSSKKNEKDGFKVNNSKKI